jgi:xanthine phosphoribosyltransferase
MMDAHIDSPRRHVAISWDQIQRDAALLAERLVRLGPFEGIVAVARGGMVPAALVSRSLGIRRVETISAVTYDGETMGEPELLNFPKNAGSGEGWLIIDDLVDTGTTMRIVRAARWPTPSCESFRRTAGSISPGK